MRRRFLQLAAALVLTLPLAGNAAAQDRSPILARIADSSTLRVGMSAGQPPFNMRSRDGSIIGLDVDLARLLSGALGVELKIVDMPFNKLLPALNKGKVDLVISGMTATLRRNMQAAFVGPYNVTGKSILARSETIAALQSQEMDKSSFKIAALKGSTSEEFVKQVAPNAKLVKTKNYDKAIDLLLSGKVDAFVADVAIIKLSMLRWPDAGLIASKTALTVEPIGIAIPPGDPLLLNLIENYLDAIKATGALKKLNEKWFNNGSWLAMLP